jgi:hypothetical protein
MVEWTTNKYISVRLYCMGDGIAQSVQKLDDRLGGQGIGARFPAEAKAFSYVHSLQTGFGAQPTYCPLGATGYFPWGKAARV